MAIRWVILDAMGVIYRVGDDVADLLVPFIQQRNEQASFERIEKSYLEASLGKINAAEFWNRAGLGSDYPEIQTQYLNSQLTLSDGCLTAIDSLSKQYKLAMLSSDVADWSRHLRAKFDLDQSFEDNVISGDCGVRKPDEAIYRHTLSQLGAPASECVFVDDRVKNLVPAKQLGFRTILFAPDAAAENTDWACTIRSFGELTTALVNC